MKDPLPSPLEQQIDLALRQLPPRKAPSTLAPRVLAAIEARQQRAWWRGPCWSWPGPIQMIVILCLLLGLAGMAWLGLSIDLADWRSTTPSWMMQFCGSVLSLGRGLISLANAGTLVVSTLLRPWLLAAMGIIFLMYLSCLGVGTIFLRVAYRRL